MVPQKTFLDTSSVLTYKNRGDQSMLDYWRNRSGHPLT